MRILAPEQVKTAGLSLTNAIRLADYYLPNYDVNVINVMQSPDKTWAITVEIATRGEVGKRSATCGGSTPFAAYTEAFKRCLMMFGICIDLIDDKILQDHELFSDNFTPEDTKQLALITAKMGKKPEEMDAIVGAYFGTIYNVKGMKMANLTKKSINGFMDWCIKNYGVRL